MDGSARDSAIDNIHVPIHARLVVFACESIGIDLLLREHELVDALCTCATGVCATSIHTHVKSTKVQALGAVALHACYNSLHR